MKLSDSECENIGFLIGLILLFLVSGCGGESKKEAVVEPEVILSSITTEYVASSTAWDIPQYYGINEDVPKYTAVGTYTNKHIPLAFWANDDLYHVYTDNTSDDNFYIHAKKNNEEEVEVHSERKVTPEQYLFEQLDGRQRKLIHTIEDWNDPHTNAVIHVLPSGLVHVHVAARGLNFKFQSGKILQSKTPYELDFECIDGCENDNIEAYPQVWDTSWGEHVGYTYYLIDDRIHSTRNIRTLWYRVGGKRTQLVEGGHYSVSVYENGVLYLAYNQLIEGKPDQRINLYMIKTVDGVNWTSIDGKDLELPLLTHDEDALIYESEGYVYLKDIKGSSVLFVESSDYDPTQGQRFIKEWTVDGVKTIAETNHNYNGAAYMGEYILTSENGVSGWGGGDMVLYKDYKEVSRNSDMNCHYPRKVIGNDLKGVASCGQYNVEKISGHYIISLE